MSESLPRGFTRRDAPAILLTAISALLGVALFRFFMVPFSTQVNFDEGCEAAAVERIIAGRWLPYVDVESIRGPFLYWTQGILHVLTGRFEYTGTRLLAMLGAVVTTVMTFLAGWAAGWADGLATVNQPDDALRAVIDAYRDSGGRGKAVLQLHVSYAPTEDEALAIAHDQWRSNVFSPPLCWDLDTVEAFDEASKHVTPEDVRGSVFVSSDLGEHAATINRYFELGFDDVYVHHVGKEQEQFIDAYARKVLDQV